MIAAILATALLLIDQRGHAFSLEALRGEPIVLTFVSAHCRDACPVINADFAQAAQLSQGRAVHFVTITLDPERDTAVDMRRLARIFSANPAQWSFVSGSVSVVRAMMHRFGVVATSGDDHTTFVYVLNARGILAATILPSTNLASQIATQVESL